MAEPAGSGCFSQLMLLLAAIIAPFFAAFQSFSTTVVSAPPLEVVYSPLAADFTSAQLEQAARIMEQRLVTLQITAATVEVADAKTILVKLPQTEDVADIYNTLGNRGLLELVDFSGIDVGGGDWDGVYIATGAGITLPFQEPTLNPLTNQPFETVLSGSAVVKAEAQESQFGGWQVAIEFNAAGGEALKIFTGSHIGEPLAIVVDSVVISVPVIQAEVSTEAVIQANFTAQAARRLAVQIGIGALPLDLQIDSVFYPG